MSVSPSLPSLKSSVCPRHHYSVCIIPKYGLFSLTIVRERTFFFFCYFSLHAHFSSCFPPCFPLSIQFFCTSLSWCAHITPVNANGFYLLMGELVSSLLHSLAAPELCYFLWCLESLETPLASTRVAQDSHPLCVFESTVSGPLVIVTPPHFYG